MSDEAARLHSANPNALPIGTRLGEFEVLRLLGVGGFGIVYLAFDHALEREVAVKEYMPAALAGRTETLHVSLRSQSDAENFALGLKSFVNEARLLARFDDPALLKVHRYWEANGTAYMAMPVLRGLTVKAVRLGLSEPPDEAWLRALLSPLLGAIEKLHEAGVYHRDIAPDNIQIEPDGHPVLLDFGAARRVLSDKSQALTAILKPAYAPIEQYAEAGSVKQGPWTDLYALGATLHYVLLQRPPPPATARAVHDDASALTTAALPGCSEDFLHTIDWMLAPRPADRPQSVAALREVLEGRAPVPLRRRPTQAAASEWERTVLLPKATAAARPEQEVAHAPTLRVPRANAPGPTPKAVPAQAVQAVAVEKSRKARPVVPLVLGLLAVVGVVVIGGVVATGMLKPEPVLAAGPAAASASTSSASASASASANALASPSTGTMLAAAPAASGVPESVVASVVLPGVGAAGPAEPGGRPAPVAAAPKKVAATTPAKAAAPLMATVNTPTSATSLAAESPKAATEAVPSAPPPVPPQATTPPAAATETAKVAPSGPEASCTGRNFLLHFACMEQACLKSANRGHADCKKWRASAVQPEI